MDGEEVEAWARASGGCSHTHSCNPPGPEDASHSHTCFHTHTHLIIPVYNLLSILFYTSIYGLMKLEKFV